jgi:predicted helicase
MFQEYFNSIQKDYLADSESSEHTFRTYFQVLLKSFVDGNVKKRKLIIKHEPANQDGKGRPDFKVTTNEQLTIGFIETKKIGENLKDILKSDQLKRYAQLSDNIILTDYLQFWLIRKGEVIFDSWICNEFELDKKRHKIPETRIEELSKLLKLFFESEPETIGNVKELAERLAVKAVFLREFSHEIVADETTHTRLHALMQAFQVTLLPAMTPEGFADIYAQTLTYSLYLAALNCDDPAKELDKNSVFMYLPRSLPLIRELFHQLEDFPDSITWAIDELISILKVTDFVAIQKEFAGYRRKDKGFSDPYIYFYEDFLHRFDKKQRKIRGVYYTPEPVVSFIVRSIEQLLKENFKIKDGFIGDNVTVLDFACGTGTFLLDVFASAIEQSKRLGDIELSKKIINEKLLKNYFGFELLVAPYVVAHLKISEFLKENGCDILPGNRLNIYLTNTLSNKKPVPFDFMPSLSEEGARANRIKNEDILVIIGNPPYAGHSANKTDWSDKEMSEYYRVDGKPLGEKNPKWLQDDYVKFIRFAQWKMDKVDRGIVGIISNHSYLDNPTFRGMRQSLMKSFDEIYILDLHGNSKKKEKCPDGSKDENVFDIQQGVAIALFIKNSPLSGGDKGVCKVRYFDLYGVRQSKYDSLWDMDKNKVKWTEANPKLPLYLFKPRDEKLLDKYDQFTSIKQIFKINGVGITTAHDDFVIDFDKEKLREKFIKFKDSKRNDDLLHEQFNVRRKKGWDILKGYDDLQTESKLDKFLVPIIYRPFDDRWIFYQDRIVWRTVKNITLNMQEENIALLSHKREELDLPWSHALITKYISEHGVMSSKTTNYQFPLYIISNGEEKMFFGIKEPDIQYGNKTKNGLYKTENFTKEFRNYINNLYNEYKTPENIMGYIYAVLHSPAYRDRYLEFLKSEFPKIPFTHDEDLFGRLSYIGNNLIDAHLLKENSFPINIDCKCIGDGNNFKVEKVLYDKGKVWINDNRYFEPVPLPIWEFYIGGYQVLDKWLKERKKHEITLSSDDYRHFINVVNVLDHTIKTMEKIDELTKDWI